MPILHRAAPAHILLVEDDPGDELMAREAFEDDALDSELHVARDGEQALDFLYRRGDFADAPRPDFILLDLNLPRVDGRQVLRQIKNDATVASIPVVVLTTSAAVEDLLACYDTHANAYITKPQGYEEFIGVVRRINEFWLDTVRLPNEEAE
ncbi:response regulator [Dactylosporangium vinaceum]|uniref:Response regulator n=1 Tax=Dactylosporangium vinaceum TaxID=53362 RepID=A0ABV5MKZ4_9ACTN|nr:response regulator [Dactylosporangium vinaceum]UAB93965.1 response regulator [Dactylosporangium vinaceum]